VTDPLWFADRLWYTSLIVAAFALGMAYEYVGSVHREKETEQ
jgi:hypothetical protein